MKTRWISVLLSLMLMVGLAGCSNDGGGVTSPSPTIPQNIQTTTPTQTPDTPDNTPSGPLVLTDAFGREVEIPEKVETIAAVGGAARIITYAGCADMLIGVTDMDKSNVTAMPYSVVNAEHFATCASVGSGGSNDTTYMEELISIAPDLIIAMPGSVETVNDIAAKTGIPVLGINPTSMFDESFYLAIELIGQAVGNEEHLSLIHI